MKSIASGLLSHLGEDVTTLATCWKIRRRDTEVLGFTDHDADIVLGGVTYHAATGIRPSAVALSASLQVDNLEMEGMLDADAIREQDILSGMYDFAEVEIFQLNYQNPNAGHIMLQRGWLGEVTLRDGRFVAEMRGLGQKLTQQVGARFSAGCRAELGDARCKVVLGEITHSGTVTEVTSRTVFKDSGRDEEESYFAAGKITFTSGANAGLSMEVKSFYNSEFTCVLPMPYDVAAGDTYDVRAGCDKTFATCVERFDNALNFRGEPHVPGMDRMLETAGTRSEWE